MGKFKRRAALEVEAIQFQGLKSIAAMEEKWGGEFQKNFAFSYNRGLIVFTQATGPADRHIRSRSPISHLSYVVRNKANEFLIYTPEQFEKAYQEEAEPVESKAEKAKKEPT